MVLLGAETCSQPDCRPAVLAVLGGGNLGSGDHQPTPRRDKETRL